MAGDEELSEAIKELIRRMEEVRNGGCFQGSTGHQMSSGINHGGIIWNIVMVMEELYGSVVKGSKDVKK